MAKHYKIDDEKKIIYADIMALTEKEEADVAKFQKYGYVVENKVEKKAIIYRLDDEYITNYLRQLENADEELKMYESVKNREALDEDKKPKTTSTGKIKLQGFNAGRNWFTRKYPEDISEITKEIEGAGKTKDLDDAFKLYEKKVKKGTTEATEEEDEGKKPMTAEEYTRDFYWKKVFVNPNPKKNKNKK